MSALSKRSDIVPEAPEKRKNGEMKIALAIIASLPGSSPDSLASRNATRMPSAFLSRLSLNAPRNWVTNSGPKLRAVKSFTSADCMALSLSYLRVGPHPHARAASRVIERRPFGRVPVSPSLPYLHGGDRCPGGGDEPIAHRAELERK